ncbi:MAG: GNAT family N-acetyltransferase [Pseudomonadota bacterium]
MATVAQIRRASMADYEALVAMQAAALRLLSQGHYNHDDIEAMILRGTMDPASIRDRACFVAEINTEIVASAAWTVRPRSCPIWQGSAAYDAPAGIPRIRSVYVHPKAARQGLATRLLHRTEADLIAHDFAKVELVATLPGIPLYLKEGWSPIADVEIGLPGERRLAGLAMMKQLVPSAAEHRIAA